METPVTDTTKLPSLPKPDIVDPGRYGIAYTAEQMHAYAKRHADALEAELEALARDVGEYQSNLTAETNARVSAETELAALKARIAGLVEKWRKTAARVGVRQFTGNDHALFANELAALLNRMEG